MRKFKASDRFTTADIGLDIEADSLSELFVGASEGMVAIIFSEKPQRSPLHSRKITLQADTPEQLLVDWLSELVYLFDTDGLIPKRYSVTVGADTAAYTLTGTVSFILFDRDVDNADHEIKAVTYYRLNIKKDGDLYRCHVVFDL